MYVHLYLYSLTEGENQVDQIRTRIKVSAEN